MHYKKYFTNSFIIHLLVCFSIINGFASTITSDSTHQKKNWFKSRTFNTIAIPSVLIGYGISTIGNNGYPSSYAVKNYFQKNYPDFHSKLDDIIIFAPIGTAYGLNIIGIKGEHNYKDLSILYLLSNIASNAITQPLKYSTKILRPDGSTYNSFPSNHTATAFVAAEVLYQEYKNKSPWIGIGGYSIASAVGVMRILNNRHWSSDVLAGAGIGILSTKLAYWAYDYYQTKKSKKLANNHFTY